MEYSKFSKVRVKNFKNTEDITLNFSDSPIISLRGENGVGKTNLVEAIRVLGLNQGNLKKLVRNGTEEFSIIAQLDDKTLIKREKGKKNKSQVIDKDGNVVLDMEKVDKGYNIKEIADRIGFWQEEESGQCLQVRRYKDQLLFSETKESENYKVLYNALKVEDILNGIRVGNDECNEAKRDVRDLLAKKQGLLEIKDGIKIYDTNELEEVKNDIEKNEEYVEQIEEIKDLAETRPYKTKEIPEINVRCFNKVEEIIELRDKLETLKADKINLPKVSKVANYLKKILIIMALSKANDIPKIYDLTEIIDLSNELKEKKKELDAVKKELSEMHIICPHCGEIVV